MKLKFWWLAGAIYLRNFTIVFGLDQYRWGIPFSLTLNIPDEVSVNFLCFYVEIWREGE